MKWLDENWFKITFSILMLLLVLTLNKGVKAINELSKNGRYISIGEGSVLDTKTGKTFGFSQENSVDIGDTIYYEYTQVTQQIKN